MTGPASSYYSPFYPTAIQNPSSVPIVPVPIVPKYQTKTPRKRDASHFAEQQNGYVTSEKMYYNFHHSAGSLFLPDSIAIKEKK